MKALTIQQPFAHIISTGLKLVENRRWFTGYRGPLAIHAGRGRDYLDLEPDVCGHGLVDVVYGVPLADMAFGAIVAVCDLADCMTLATARSAKVAKKYPWLAEHEHTEGPFCWVLQSVRRLEEPIPAKGAQGLCDWTPAAELRFAGATQ